MTQIQAPSSARLLAGALGVALAACAEDPTCTASAEHPCIPGVGSIASCTVVIPEDPCAFAARRDVFIGKITRIAASTRGILHPLGAPQVVDSCNYGTRALDLTVRLVRALYGTPPSELEVRVGAWYVSAWDTWPEAEGRDVDWENERGLRVVQHVGFAAERFADRDIWWLDTWSLFELSGEVFNPGSVATGTFLPSVNDPCNLSVLPLLGRSASSLAEAFAACPAPAPPSVLYDELRADRVDASYCL